MGKCVIVGAGDFFGLRRKPGDDDFVIAADGGYDYLFKEGIRIDLLIGDMDSINKDFSQINCIILPTKKDDTDMIAAMREGLKKGFTQFEIYGALGGRLDHTLANVQSLLFLKNKNANGIIYGKEDSLELISNESRIFSSDMSGMISVFAYGGNAHHVTERGLEYEVNDETLECGFPLGVSNQFIGKQAMIEVKDGKLLIYVHKAL